MSFRANPSQQLNMEDSLLGLTERERRALDGSWAKVFGDEVFPMIDESRFAVLYSDKASRPNTPVNVVVGALIIKELFDYTDDELVESLMFDLRLQYALHTTSFDEQPLSDKTLPRFRRRCYEHELATGEDLWRDCVKGLAAATARMMGIDGRVRRMDSMMVGSNIRVLSRLELVFECVARVCRRLRRERPDLLPGDLAAYADPDEFNRVFYHRKDEPLEERVARILADADALAAACGAEVAGWDEWGLLCRCLREQTVVDGEGELAGVRRMRAKEDGMPGSRMLQNPSDPDATYRVKAGRKHRGYAANIEESVGANGSVVTGYQYDVNVRGDSDFLREAIEEAERIEGATLVTDGGYDGQDNAAAAEEKGIDLVVTALVGKDPEDALADFEWSDDGERLLRCAAGHEPRSCSYAGSTRQAKVSFDASLCEGCPLEGQCKPRIKGGRAELTVSKNATRRARHKRRMGEEGFRHYARLRNGAETVPSNMRRNYRLDKLPRGRIRGKLFFGAKVAALNFRKLVGFLSGTGRSAANPLLAAG